MPSSGEVDTFNNAISAIDNGCFQDAINILTQVVTNSKATRNHLLTGLLLRGAAWLKLKDVQRAERDWRAVLTIDPKNKHAIKRLNSLPPTSNQLSLSAQREQETPNSVAQNLNADVNRMSLTDVPQTKSILQSWRKSESTSKFVGKVDPRPSKSAARTQQRSTSLPYEIWLIISEYLPPREHSSWLSLSRAHRSIALPLAFKDIRLALGMRDATASGSAGSRNSRLETSTQFSRSREILERMKLDPVFAAHVKNITIFAVKSRHSEKLCNLLVDALQYAGSLLSFTWLLGYRELPKEVVQVLSTKVPSLRHFSIRGRNLVTTNLTLLRNLHSLSIFSFPDANDSREALATIVHNNSSTLRSLTLASEIQLRPPTIGSTISGNPSLMPSIDNLEHLTIQTMLRPIISNVFEHGANLRSLIIHLMNITHTASTVLRELSSTANLPNLKEFTFLVSDKVWYYWLDWTCFLSVMAFLSQEVPNVERLWIKIPTSLFLASSESSKLWDLSQLRVLRLDFKTCVGLVDLVIAMMEKLPTSLEALYIEVQLYLWSQVAQRLEEGSKANQDESKPFLPSLKYLVLEETPHRPRVTENKHEIEQVAKLHSGLEIVGDGNDLFDVIRTGEHVRLVLVDDIRRRKLYGENQDYSLNSLEWMCREINETQ
ncbi:hypothetical protein FRC02_005796 [Tulasnella sp. 418]|nr:hypothetical protein FRC02_005796 [Tulasnella sp. 418]